MPCNNDGYDTDTHTMADVLADMLCRILSATEDLKSMPPDIQLWWVEHQRRDKARLESNKRDKALRIKRLKEELERVEKEDI